MHACKYVCCSRHMLFVELRVECLFFPPFKTSFHISSVEEKMLHGEVLYNMTHRKSARFSPTSATYKDQQQAGCLVTEVLQVLTNSHRS